MDYQYWILVLAVYVVCVSEGHRQGEEAEWREDLGSDSMEWCDQYHHGCTVQENRCRCDRVKGCLNPWPYKNMEECQEDLEGSLDVCKHHHTCNTGFCVQTKHHGQRKARCECAGTGFYGKSCHKKCPQMLGRLEMDFPPACLLA